MELPSKFAILRTLGTSGPYFQLLESSCSNRLHCVWIAPEKDGKELDEAGSQWILLRPYNTGIYDAQVQLPHGNQTYKYWYLPVVLQSQSGSIPVIEFQYKSWIPMGGHRIPIRNNENGLMELYHQALQEKHKELQRQEGLAQTTTTQDQWWQQAIQGSPPPQLPQPRVQPPPPRVQRQPRQHQERPSAAPSSATKPFPLPTHVGQLLLQQARSGSESCPIAAQPYSECSTLTVTSCFHIFDKASLERWTQTHDTCPVCRVYLTNRVNE